MKTIHTGDWHIKIPTKHEKWYIQRIVNFFKILKDENPDEIVITGDIFHRVPTSLEIGLFLGFLFDLECPIYIVAGNHDRATKPNIRSEYLEVLLKLINIPRITWACREIVEDHNYVLVPNYLIRQGEEIPIVKDKILLSHIRHELQIAGKTRKAEYDLSKLKEYKLVLLSDIHNTVKYSDNIFYSTSPYRTHRKTITSLDDVSSDIFGYNCIFNNSIEHRSIHLPNHYIFKVQEKIGEINSNNLIEIEYQIPYDQLDEFEGENVVVLRESNEINFKNDIYEVISEILVRDYKIVQPSSYIELLVDIVGELNVDS